MKTVLVTGAAGGIGAATCRYFEERGYRVLAHVRSAERAEALCEGTTWLPIHGDVTRDGDVASIAAQVEEAGSLDLLVHNAGVLSRDRQKGPHGVGIQAEVNVLAPFTLTKALVPLLHESEAPQVFTLTSSAANFALGTDYAKLADPDGSSLFGHYALSKAAANALTVAMAKLFPHIAFAATEPGFVTTDMTAANPSMPWVMAKLAPFLGTTPEKAVERSYDMLLASQWKSGIVVQNGKPVRGKRWEREEAQASLHALFDRAGLPLRAD